MSGNMSSSFGRICTMWSSQLNVEKVGENPPPSELNRARKVKGRPWLIMLSPNLIYIIKHLKRNMKKKKKKK